MLQFKGRRLDSKTTKTLQETSVNRKDTLTLKIKGFLKKGKT